jgi:dethiobiotin synthetase
LKKEKKMNLFITATNTNIGKTYTTLRLIKKFAEKGYRVGVFKPIETGVDKIPLDGMKLLEEVRKYNREFEKIGIDEIVPNQFQLPASPFVAGKVDFKKIDESFKKISSHSDIVLIEGAGGVMVPVKDNFYMFDFINYFKAKSLLVVQSKLGCINDLELNLNFFKPDVWAINLFDREEFFKISYPYLKDRYKNVLTIQDNLDTIVSLLSQKERRK